MGLALLVSACFNEPNYSNTPAITFRSVSKYTLAAGTGVGQSQRDSVVVSLGFTDGNGDLGEDTSDTTRINQIFGKESWGNYEIKTFQLVDGKYSELTLDVLSKLFFMRLTKDNQRGPIDGSLDFNQKFFYQRGYKMVPVKFQIRIRDRDLNVSNTIETDTISVPLNGR